MLKTETERMNEKLTIEAQMNESDMVRQLIEEDINSVRKKKMLEGERYYCCEHDILKKDFTQARLSETRKDENGKEYEAFSIFRNPNRSNYHTVNPFHKILVDQKTSYICGREPSISVRGEDQKEYERMLMNFANEEFNEMLQEWIIGASNNGFEVVHFYYDRDGKLQYSIIPARECIPIYDARFEKDLEQMIRYYDTTIWIDGKKVVRKRVEWWTKEEVRYYTEKEENCFLLDETMNENPSPHWWTVTSVDEMEKSKKAHSWGRVPFIILRNNAKETTDLEAMKGLIDAYDLISSEGTNNLADLVDLYWVIAGYGSETAAAIARKLQINKAVHITDSSGKIEAKQTELSAEGRLEWLKMLRRDIFQFGQGIDTDIKNFGNAPSGVSLKFQYALLDLKADSMIAKLKKALREFFWFITEDYNRRMGTEFDSSKIEFEINKSLITNDKELVEMIGMSRDLLSQKTLISKHPFVSDINAEIDKIEDRKQLFALGTALKGSENEVL